MPVVAELAARTGVPVSVDTSRPDVMAAVDARAAMVNDVRRLREPGAIEVVTQAWGRRVHLPLAGEPVTMQVPPTYVDVVEEVTTHLRTRVDECTHAGIDRSGIVLDPGFGFGKTLEHNLAIFAALPRLADLGPPTMVGLSRKSMLGEITGRAVADRLPASVVAAALVAQAGVRVIRVRDVAATGDALRVLEATGRDPE